MTNRRDFLKKATFAIPALATLSVPSIAKAIETTEEPAKKFYGPACRAGKPSRSPSPWTDGYKPKFYSPACSFKNTFKDLPQTPKGQFEHARAIMKLDHPDINHYLWNSVGGCQEELINRFLKVKGLEKTKENVNKFFTEEFEDENKNGHKLSSSIYCGAYVYFLYGNLFLINQDEIVKNGVPPLSKWYNPRQGYVLNHAQFPWSPGNYDYPDWKLEVRTLPQFERSEIYLIKDHDKPYRITPYAKHVAFGASNYSPYGRGLFYNLKLADNIDEFESLNKEQLDNMRDYNENYNKENSLVRESHIHRTHQFVDKYLTAYNELFGITERLAWPWPTVMSKEQLEDVYKEHINSNKY